jgi:hypothetical protein
LSAESGPCHPGQYIDVSPNVTGTAMAIPAVPISSVKDAKSKSKSRVDIFYNLLLLILRRIRFLL